MRIRNPRAWRAFLRGSYGLATSYVDGDWESDDLVALTRIAARNVVGLDRLRARLAPGTPSRAAPGPPRARADDQAQPASDRRALRPRQRSVRALPRRDAQLLQRNLRVSETTLYEASIAKLDAVCRKLDLGPDDHVLEIGTGWGGFAIHAAGRYGARVTTTTISQRAVRAGPGARPRGRSGGSGHGLAQGLPRARGPLRQAGVDRDDRGRGLAVLRDLLPLLLEAAEARTARCSCRRSRSPTRLRGGEGRSQLRQHADLPRRLPALGGRDRPLPAHRHRHGPGASRRLDRQLRHARGRWRERFERATRSWPGSATTIASGGSGGSTSPTAREASPSGGSASASSCSPSPASARPAAQPGQREPVRAFAAGAQPG